jgi:hypothetical protein
MIKQRNKTHITIPLYVLIEVYGKKKSSQIGNSLALLVYKHPNFSLLFLFSSSIPSGEEGHSSLHPHVKLGVRGTAILQ